MTTWLFRLTVALLALFALAAHAEAAPCSILLEQDLPCDIQQGSEAPYSGVLMTESTAWDLTSRIYKVKELELQIGLLNATAAIDAKLHDKVVYALKVELENQPNVFYESPWFWLAAIGAFTGGLGLGLSL